MTEQVSKVTERAYKKNTKRNKQIKQSICIGYDFPKKTWSRLKNYLLGPKQSDSSSKTTYIVLFPGPNSKIYVKIPQKICFNWFWPRPVFVLLVYWVIEFGLLSKYIASVPRC